MERNCRLTAIISLPMTMSFDTNARRQAKELFDALMDRLVGDLPTAKRGKPKRRYRRAQDPRRRSPRLKKGRDRRGAAEARSGRGASEVSGAAHKDAEARWRPRERRGKRPRSRPPLENAEAAFPRRERTRRRRSLSVSPDKERPNAGRRGRRRGAAAPRRR